MNDILSSGSEMLGREERVQDKKRIGELADRDPAAVAADQAMMAKQRKIWEAEARSNVETWATHMANSEFAPVDAPDATVIFRDLVDNLERIPAKNAARKDLLNWLTVVWLNVSEALQALHDPDTSRSVTELMKAPMAHAKSLYSTQETLTEGEIEAVVQAVHLTAEAMRKHLAAELGQVH